MKLLFSKLERFLIRNNKAFTLNPIKTGDQKISDSELNKDKEINAETTQRVEYLIRET